MTIRVVLADDHPLVREGLRAVLESESDIQLLAEAESGNEALRLVEREAPDVLLIDVGLPDISGLEAIRQLRAQGSRVGCLLLTIYDSERYLVEAIQAGANGYLLKDQPRDLIPQAIRTVAAGGNVFPQAILGRALSTWSNPSVPKPPPVALSPRELEMLALIAKGHGNKAIADKLHLAESTVKKYVHTMMGKLGASDRAHAATTGLRMGLVD